MGNSLHEPLRKVGRTIRRLYFLSKIGLRGLAVGRAKAKFTLKNSFFAILRRHRPELTESSSTANSR